MKRIEKYVERFAHLITNPIFTKEHLKKFGIFILGF